MKIASAVIRNQNDINRNIELMVARINEAVSEKADMILFSEGELSGRTFGRDLEKDAETAVSVDDERLKVFSKLALDNHIVIGFGLLELSGEKYYNSYIIFDSEGLVKLKYRMINEDWHLNSDRYQSGESVNCWVIDDLGFSILMGADAFDEVTQSMVSALDVDICFIPRASNLDDIKTDNLLDHNLINYIRAVKKMNTNVLMINQYLEKDGEELFYGGVNAINTNGEIEESLKIRTEGILYIEI